MDGWMVYFIMWLLVAKAEGKITWSYKPAIKTVKQSTLWFLFPAVNDEQMETHNKWLASMLDTGVPYSHIYVVYITFWYITVLLYPQFIFHLLSQWKSVFPTPTNPSCSLMSLREREIQRRTRWCHKVYFYHINDKNNSCAHWHESQSPFWVALNQMRRLQQ